MKDFDGSHFRIRFGEGKEYMMGLLIVGFVLSLAGVGFLLGEILDFASCTQRITAKVVKMEKDKGSYWRGTYRYYPVFAYTIDGKEYKGKDRFSPTRRENKYHVGTEVAVKCNPGRPKQFRTGPKASTYLLSGVLLAVGILFWVCYFL